MAKQGTPHSWCLLTYKEPTGLDYSTWNVNASGWSVTHTKAYEDACEALKVMNQPGNIMYQVKLKGQELYYGGFMAFYESENRGAEYPLDRANKIAESFRESGGDIEVILSKVKQDELNVDLMKNPIESFENIIQQVIVKTTGSDAEHYHTHFLIVQHRNTDLLDIDESEIAIWVVNEDGKSKDGIISCHIGNHQEFERWQKQAEAGTLIMYLLEQWDEL
jgi:hypothetical protein